MAISRGIVYSVHAQDLLMYRGALDENEARELYAFHSAIFVLLLDSLMLGLAITTAIIALTSLLD